MISLYRPGTSPLHRAPAGLKLALLALLGVGFSLMPRQPIVLGLSLAAGGLVLVVAFFALAELAGRPLLRQLWSTRWIVVAMVGTQLIFLTPGDAAVNTVRVVAIVLLAGLLSLTTRSSDVLAALETGLGPLRRLGVDPRRVGLTLSLAITMVPVIAALAQRVREAQRARGVRLGFRAVVPLLVLALRHADDVADALSARGVD
ncbi:energy-coupling factor transporter transmembrane component T family protein [Schumannella soli]|uniref:Energy-coupling factor transporter transmembrane protein EcfT n=1 Tax=Schumannella soli TaxID=2590779 RepID=A0A506Y137_9MICO|nr:energy-coupling factor transporter transmembrane component T [Schumannella soli]TPW76256.1 energy-coupling factor transporter transmembrane protein EcfT [Schumannella soli]